MAWTPSHAYVPIPCSGRIGMRGSLFGYCRALQYWKLFSCSRADGCTFELKGSKGERSGELKSGCVPAKVRPPIGTLSRILAEAPLSAND